MRLLLAAALVLLAPTSAAATLIEVDLAAPGDALVTRDPEAGLDWLDPTETTGLSVNQVIAGAGGFASDGWRHATFDELVGFMDQLGPLPFVLGFTAMEVQDLDLFRPHLEILGVTRQEGSRRELLAWNRTEEGPRAVEIWVDDLPAPLSAGIDFGLLGDPGEASDGIGHFLVRSVPEASAAALLGLGGAAALFAAGRPHAPRDR